MAAKTHYPYISDNPHVQALYELARENQRKSAILRGETIDENLHHRFAEMLALRSPPRANTDRELFAGVGTLDKQFQGDPAGLREVIAGARAQGYTPSPHDFYCEPLAEQPGDPHAFVPPTGGRGHIRRVCEQRGLECRGAVTVKGRQPESDPYHNPKVKLGEDIIQAETKRAIARDPALRRKSKREVREAIIDKHTLKL